MPLRFRRRLCFALLMVACCVGLARLYAQGPTWSEHLSPGEINALVNTNGLRIADLRVNTSSGRPLFDVVLVANDDGRAWSWSFDLTAARMQAMLKAAPRRPVVMVPYKVAPGDTRLAVVWTPGAVADTAVDWVVMVDVSNDALVRIRGAGGPGQDPMAGFAAASLTPERVVSYSTASGERYAIDERFRQKAETAHRPAWGGPAGESVSVSTPSGSKESPRGSRGRTLANETRGKRTRELLLRASRELDRFESCTWKSHSHAICCHGEDDRALNDAAAIHATRRVTTDAVRVHARSRNPGSTVLNLTVPV